MRNAPTAGLAVAFTMALGAAPGLAQEAAGEASGHADALTLSCADLAALDPETGAGLIHYIAGYSDGQSVAIAAAGPAVPEEGAAESSGTEGDTDGDQAAAGGEAASEAATDTGNAGGQAAGGAAAGLGISVDEVMTACVEAPDSPASEVIKVARGASQPEMDPQDDDPAAEGEDGQDVGSGNAVVE